MKSRQARALGDLDFSGFNLQENNKLRGNVLLIGVAQVLNPKSFNIPYITLFLFRDRNDYPISLNFLLILQSKIILYG